MGVNQIGTPLVAAYAAQSGLNVNLYRQHRIEMSCTATCQAQLLTPTMTSLNTQMQAVYSDLKVLVYVTAIGGGVCMLWCLYLISQKSEADQEQYLQFWGAALLVLVVTCILLGLLVHSMSTQYNATRNSLPAVAACITNTQWKALPNNIFAQSSMESEHNWAITWLVVGVLLALAMAWTMM